MLAKAREAYVAGGFEDALRIYDALIAEFPQRAVFWNDRGVTQDAVARHPDAERNYRRALELYPGYELAFRNLSNCLVFQGRDEEALDALLSAVEVEPNYEGAYRDAFAILLSRGPTAAEVRYARKLVAATHSPFARFVLGVVAAEAGDTRLAARELKAAVGSLSTDAALRERVGDEFPRVAAEFEKALGNALFAREDLGPSVDAYRRSVDANPKDEEAWNNLGFAYYTAGENGLAIDCFGKAVEVNPTYKHAWYNLAYTFQTVDLLDEAIKAYDKTLECDPHDEVAWNNRGNAEYNLGRYEASIPYFERAVELQPNYDIAWNNIGNALNKAGRHAEAVPFHERAIKSNPAFDYAWYALSKSRFHTGDLSGAVRDIERCLEVNREFDSGWVMKAEILMHLGDAEEALEAAEQAVALNPANDHAHFVHGEILESLGRPDAAEAAYGRAIAVAADGARIRERVPDAWTSLGEMLLSRDRLKEARASFAKAAEINPGSLIAREGALDALLRLGEYREAVLALRSPGVKEAPHEIVARIRLYLDTGDFAAVHPTAVRYRQWYGEEAEVRLLEGEALLALGRPAEARAAFDRAVREVERALAKERAARERAQSTHRPRHRRGGKESPGKGAKEPPKGGRKGGADEWVDIEDGRKQIQALQEEGAFLDSFAEEPSGENALLEELYRAKVLSAQAARGQGGEGDARTLLEQAARLRPDRAAAWFDLGSLALGARSMREARAAFERAVGAEPESELGWVGLLRLAQAEGNDRRSARLRAAVARVAPGHPVLGAKEPGTAGGAPRR